MFNFWSPQVARASAFTFGLVYGSVKLKILKVLFYTLNHIDRHEQRRHFRFVFGFNWNLIFLQIRHVVDILNMLIKVSHWEIWIKVYTHWLLEYLLYGREPSLQSTKDSFVWFLYLLLCLHIYWKILAPLRCDRLNRCRVLRRKLEEAFIILSKEWKWSTIKDDHVLHDLSIIYRNNWLFPVCRSPFSKDY